MYDIAIASARVCDIVFDSERSLVYFQTFLTACRIFELHKLQQDKIYENIMIAALQKK